MITIKKNVRSSFVAMIFFFVVIVILIHGTMSFQLAKIQMNAQLEKTSDLVLQQFILSFKNFEDVKDQLLLESVDRFDKEVFNLYQKIDRIVTLKLYGRLYRPITDSNLFDVSIRPVNLGTSRYLKEKIGVDYESLQPYKMVNFNLTGSNGESISKRILVGKSSDEKQIIIIEMSIDQELLPMNFARESIEKIINTNQYLSDLSSKFYILDKNGDIQYTTGNKLDAQLMNSMDSLTGKSIKRIVTSLDDGYVDVYYWTELGMNRSGLRVQFDHEHQRYYLFEMDQSQIFKQIDSYIHWFWYASGLMILMVFGTVFYLWRKNQIESRGDTL